MKEVSYNITFLVDDDVSDEDISWVCGSAFVQINEPVVPTDDEWNDRTFDVEVVSEKVEIVPNVSV
jgi:hypothetical protein